MPIMPPNPLLEYRSYSYHHILVACTESNVADFLMQTQNVENFTRTDSSSERKHTTRKGGGGEYVVIINSMTDSDFIINSVKWQTIMAPGFGSNSPTTMATEGVMEIMEPHGIRFLNVLDDVYNALRSDPSGVIFLLKTIFVGHKDNSTTNTIGENVANIRPFGFTPYDITADFSEAGATYNFSFIATMNGTGKMPQIADLSTTTSITTGNTLFDGMDALAKKINAQYDKNVELETKRLKEKDPTFSFKDTYRKVKYVINLDPSYGDKYVLDINGSVVDTTKNGKVTFSFTNKTNIESAINQIMQSCGQVKRDMNGKDKKMYKIHSFLSTSGNEFKITYYIRPYTIAESSVKLALKGNKELEKKFPVLDYDYIFTGKNVEVLEFDMKMAMGLAFFQSILTAQASKDDNAGSTNNESKPDAKPSAAKSVFGTDREKTPFFIGTRVKDPITANSVTPEDDVSFRSQLARHAALEMMEAKMTIIGNPNIMGNLILSEDEFLSNNKTGTQTWPDQPILVKVNVKMPTDPDKRYDYESFWYDGYYYLLSIENIFEGGQFTQVLDMFSLPINNETEE